MLFWHNQRMPVIVIFYIKERKGLGVLEYFITWQFARDYFAKDTHIW